MKNYIVATTKPWNIEVYNRLHGTLPGNWHLAHNPEELYNKVQELKPRYVFFPHWSWIVSLEVLNKAECVCFHMADVPYGRGGSPLQNLISRGHKDTVLSALRMVEELDAGPVYLKKPLSLAGSAQEIFERCALLTYDLIHEIIENEPAPVAQQGTPVVFKRRTPSMSRLPETGFLEGLYDHIRMLDAETYPHAYIEYGDFRIEFTGAVIDPDRLTAKVKITRKTGSDDENF